MKLRENEVLLFRGDSITDGIHPTITGLSLQKDNGSNALRKNGVNNLKGRSVYDDTEFNKRNKEIENYKIENSEKSNSKRLYSNSDIKKILSVKSKYSDELNFMSILGCRVHELCNIKVKDINLKNMTVFIKGKGGRPSYRPIIPTQINFIKDLVKGKNQDEKVFNVPIDEKKTRQNIGAEIRKITKDLGLPVSSKCHEFRKYAAQNYFHYLVDSCGYSVKDAEEITVSKLLSHGKNREDLKNIYLRS